MDIDSEVLTESTTRIALALLPALRRGREPEEAVSAAFGEAISIVNALLKKPGIEIAGGWGHVTLDNRGSFRLVTHEAH